MTIQALASAVDSALSSLATAIDALVAQSNSNDVMYRASHNSHPHPVYEAVGPKIRAAVASNATLRTYLRLDPHNPAVSLASLFPPSD